ncbi:MAG: hypothetical protein JWR69_1743 [Pedosphaera sp.]|nr:hypothetical protein [Pedosphaera sp.]
MKSWKTTTLGIICWIICVWLCVENYRREAWPFHYWAVPILAFATGWGLLHARDHAHKD